MTGSPVANSRFRICSGVSPSIAITSARSELPCATTITRLPAAAVEQNHDARGMIWPEALAPFTVVVCPIGADRSEAVKLAAAQVYGELLAAGVDVLLDDRGERPGAMFADWELIGVPHRIAIGDRGLKEGSVEYQHRRDTEATAVPLGDVAAWVASKVRAALAY